MPQLSWRATSSGARIWSSPQWSAYTGLSAEESRGHGWLGAVHQADHAETGEAWRQTAEARAFTMEHRLRQAADGGWRWFETRVVPVFQGGGLATEWVGLSCDVHELRAMREREGALLSGLQHNVRNMFGVIHAIVRRTGERAETVDEFATHLEGRIGAISRVQSAALRNPGAGVDLAALLADELAAYAAHEGARVTIDGPPVRLKERAAETFALAMHELATNAVKFGALSAPGGQVNAQWTVFGDPPPRLRLVWQESGVALLEPATRHRGFGTELLERTLPYELAARTERRFAHDGVRCTIEFPLSGRAVGL